MTEVSIITLNFNREHYLDNWLSTWYKYPRNFSYEILLLDNGSNPKKFRKFYERWCGKKEIRWIEFGKNLGFGKPHNEASKYAQGEFLVFSNPDTLIYERGVEKLIDFLKKHQGMYYYYLDLGKTEVKNDKFSADIIFNTPDEKHYAIIHIKFVPVTDKPEEPLILDKEKESPKSIERLKSLGYL